MRVLVTGVAGTVGSAVAGALERHGHTVVGVDRMRADLFDPAALAPLLEGVDGAVHAASSNDARAGELDRTVLSTVFDAFAGSDRPVVYTSGLWLHGDTGAEPATEDSPLAPPLVVSWRPELDKLVGAAVDRGVRTVRIRPALVYGYGRGYPAALLTPNDAVVRYLGEGTNRWATVHADDLGDLYVRALEAAPAGSVYLGGAADRSEQVRDIAAAVATRAGARVESWDPAEAEQVWGPMVEALLLDQVASGERAARDLGWRPTRPSILEGL
ncbi:NAD-dependent epimerase/dehydratase family protein [Tenggerimyces flavus]|uniref:NAD-dependent epimerase/dehydratase family protein n=1 Tax=Tenggerimyces flavus TaxID=1708749 RepID=A0ABV7Y6I2_9ACTN|nr:NAD-dependent epimerase/dehydratase family protein [Tenggerimyces flavus]MBM7785291.1 nucleoside-diphosphate-sugar epimerase [Tenggerimyces flavus]